MAVAIDALAVADPGWFVKTRVAEADVVGSAVKNALRAASESPPTFITTAKVEKFGLEILTSASAFCTKVSNGHVLATIVLSNDKPVHDKVVS